MSSATQKASVADPSRADRIATLQAQAASQHATLKPRQPRIRQLGESGRTFQRKTVGGTSEQASSAQLGLFNEAEEITATEASEVAVKPHSRQRRRPPTLPPELAREEIVYDLPEADKVCPHDGEALERIGEEIG